MRILGIDPGVATIGFGLVEAQRSAVRLLQYGVITTPAGLPLSVRLHQISQDMSQLLEQLSVETPDCVESSLKVHVSNLRRKLREAGAGEVIEAVWGIGFKLAE